MLILCVNGCCVSFPFVQTPGASSVCIKMANSKSDLNAPSSPLFPTATTVLTLDDMVQSILAYILWFVKYIVRFIPSLQFLSALQLPGMFHICMDNAEMEWKPQCHILFAGFCSPFKTHTHSYAYFLTNSHAFICIFPYYTLYSETFAFLHILGLFLSWLPELSWLHSQCLYMDLVIKQLIHPTKNWSLCLTIES